MKLHSIVPVLLIILMIAFCGCSGKPAEPATPLPTPVPATPVATTAIVVTTIETTVIPTEEPDLYPTALKIKGVFNYSSGKTLSQGTVYYYWLNDTYQLFDPRETRYVTKYPATGNRYLIIFVNTVNRGTSRNIPVASDAVQVHYEGMTFYRDPTHVLPDAPKTEKKLDAPPEVMRIGEIEFLHKLYGSEYVEDFGYSHGNKQAFLNPGESNAIDGYIVYEVPASLVPQKTYVEIAFNPQEAAIWKLVTK